LVTKKYVGMTLDQDLYLKSTFTKHCDLENNNFKHFMYMVNVPEITAMIKGSKIFPDGIDNKRNIDGKLPINRLHAIKEVLSDDEGDDA
jgi:hypothetical protein